MKRQGKATYNPSIDISVDWTRYKCKHVTSEIIRTEKMFILGLEIIGFPVGWLAGWLTEYLLFKGGWGCHTNMLRLLDALTLVQLEVWSI